MRFQLLTDRRAKRVAGCNIETPLMPRTFDRVAQYEAVRKMRFLVRTPAVGGIEAAVDAIDGEGCTAMVKTHDVFFIDVAGLTRDDPLTLIQHFRYSQIWTFCQVAERIDSRCGRWRRIERERSRVGGIE